MSFRKVNVSRNVLGLNTKGFLFQSLPFGWRRSSKTLSVPGNRTVLVYTHRRHLTSNSVQHGQPVSNGTFNSQSNCADCTNVCIVYFWKMANFKSIYF